MRDFPRWLLALSFVSLVPLLLCPLFLFGAHPFGTSESTFVSFLLYVLTQLLWLVPIVLFFTGLELYRRGAEWAGIAIEAVSAAASIAAIVAVFA